MTFFLSYVLCTDSFPNICVEIVSDCPTVFRVEATWDVQLGEREVENIRNCQFLCRVRLCCVRSQECRTLHSHQAGLIVCTRHQDISLAWRTAGLQVIRIDLYKLPDINEECHERERERERSEQREYNKYMFIYKESPERDLLPLSSEIRITLGRGLDWKMKFKSLN